MLTNPIPNKAAEFWLDDILLPVTPQTMSIKNNNQNESGSLVDGDPITIAKLDKAQTLEIGFMVPIYLETLRECSWVYSDSVIRDFKDLTDWLWRKKQDRERVIVTILYPDGSHINGAFLLDDYSYKQDASNGSDYEFSVTFTEYYPADNQEIDVELQNTLVRHGLRDVRRIS